MSGVSHFYLHSLLFDLHSSCLSSPVRYNPVINISLHFWFIYFHLTAMLHLSLPFFSPSPSSSISLSYSPPGQLKTSLEHYSGDYQTYQNTLAEKKVVQARARVAYEKEKEKLKGETWLLSPFHCSSSFSSSFLLHTNQLFLFVHVCFCLCLLYWGVTADYSLPSFCWLLRLCLSPFIHFLLYFLCCQ